MAKSRNRSGRTTAKTAARNVGSSPPVRDAKDAAAKAVARPAKAGPVKAKPAGTDGGGEDQADRSDRVGRRSKPVKPAETPGLADKGGDGKSGPRAKPAPTKRTAPTPSARYTPPIPKSQKVSPKWVPILMFTCLGLGMAMIILNYVNVLPGKDPSNVYLMIGLGLITIGFVTATKYH